MHPENIYPTPEDRGHGQTPQEHHITGLDTGLFHHRPPTQPVSHSELTQSSTQPQDSSPAWPAAPSSGTAALQAPADDKPVPVLEVLSVRGVEYGMMTLVLWVGAITMAWIILNMVNGSRGFDFVVVPVSALVVCVPIFGWFFLRLKKAELADPKLRFDPSKRRWSQITQILTYTIVLVNFIYFVYVILSHFSDSHGPSIVKALINLVVITLVAGGILVYYWFDEHRLLK